VKLGDKKEDHCASGCLYYYLVHAIGVAGAGGVIYDSEGKKITDYSWGLGKTTNNKAEILAAYMGLKLAQDLNIQILTVLGDSEIIIKELRGMSRPTKDPTQKHILSYQFA
jgi:ribonuclease HI